MRLRNPKRSSLLGFAAVAVAVSMAGTAFACTQLVGAVTITSGGVSETYQGNGKDETDTATRGYCAEPIREQFSTNPDVALVFTLDVQRTSSCYSAVPLDAIPHQVRWIRAPSTAVTHDGTANCLGNEQDPTNPWVVVGELVVNSTGTSSGTFALPPTMIGSGNICVTNGLTLAAPMMFINWV